MASHEVYKYPGDRIHMTLCPKSQRGALCTPAAHARTDPRKSNTRTATQNAAAGIP